MSTNKRHNSTDEAADADRKSHAPSPQKKPRFSVSKRSFGHGRRIRPDVIQDDGHRPPTALMQPFRQHHQFRFLSERAKPPNRNKRPTSGHRPFYKMSNPFSPNSEPYSGLPEKFDVSPGLRDAVPPAADKAGNFPWSAEHAAFINSAAGLGNVNWVGKRPLGFGSFGTAGLWERCDENNVLLEQMVIKESNTVPVEKWGQVPEEVKMMRRMEKTGCQAVPKLIAYKRYAHVRKHRIYMEFCPYSDLYGLDLNYKRFRTYLPEPFLWYTFNNLVKVAVAMQYGENGTSWDYQIVHRDLKPANIFLGLEDERSGFPSYPVVKTGDWGLATKVKSNDLRNPVGLRGAGTESYLAPEQRVPDSMYIFRAQEDGHLDGTYPLTRLSAYTNIWAIGAIMFELLTHEAVACYLHNDEWTINEAFVDIPNARNPRYSGALTELIRLCLMPDPWDRPNVEELELKIETRCRTIMKEYAAKPHIRQKDRLYYKGSEINEMPPGTWNYWNPGGQRVPRPSDPPDPQDFPDPFSAAIVYPDFPHSERDNPEEGRRSRGGGVGQPIIIPDGPRRSRTGNNANNPIILPSNSAEEGQGLDNSDSSDDSENRRRRAAKKLPSP